MRSVFIILAFFSFSLASCYYDNEEELYPVTQCNVDSMSYVNDVIPILDNAACFACHSEQANFGNVNLSSYDQVKKYVDDGSLIGSIKHDSGFSAMPQNANKMSPCNINKVQAWITQGAKNN